MLGSRLARRIVLPLLLLIGGLFAVLAVVAVQIADGRVSEELEGEADRVASTLSELHLAPEHRPAILGALARLVGTDLIVDGYATNADWSSAEVRAVRAGRAELGGAAYRVLERPIGRGADRCLVLVAEERISQRRRDVLTPVAVAGAFGLLVALGLGLAVARMIARPVRELADSVKGFAAGEFDGAVGDPGPGEIGDLQDAFVRMVGAIREGEQRLRESERLAALGRLSGGIAHELRNPLTAIRMAVETATAGGDPARTEARQVALSEIDRLDRTLRELLDYARPREPVLEEVKLAPLFADVAALLGPQCEHLDVRLEVEAPDGLAVRADPDRLKQALLNLVLNGAQAQPEGGVVRLRARGCKIEVSDEGSGIPAGVRESLLQPFVTTREAGIGLGLAVVAQIAEEHRAALDFSTGRAGTTFSLEFPAG